MSVKDLEGRSFHSMSVEELTLLCGALYQQEQDANEMRKRASAVLRIKQQEREAEEAVEKAKVRLDEVQQKIPKATFIEKLRARLFHGEPG
jgi:hypothetical protein